MNLIIKAIRACNVIKQLAFSFKMMQNKRTISGANTASVLALYDIIYIQEWKRLSQTEHWAHRV